MYRRLGSATLSRLVFAGESNPNFQLKKSHWDNTAVKSKRKNVKEKYMLPSQISRNCSVVTYPVSALSTVPRTIHNTTTLTILPIMSDTPKFWTLDGWQLHLNRYNAGNCNCNIFKTYIPINLYSWNFMQIEIILPSKTPRRPNFISVTDWIQLLQTNPSERLLNYVHVRFSLATATTFSFFFCSKCLC